MLRLITRFPARPSHREKRRIAEVLRKESVGGLLLVLFATTAIIWANSPWADNYFALRDLTFGVPQLHLELSLGQWAADGLLAIFFFLVGLELKHEFVAGDLRNLRSAVVPVLAAAGGVVVPALIYFAVAGGDPVARGGWAIPTATDIAFAVAVLALIGSHLPSSLRVFLLTLAVVDDLIAITIIAVFYTATVNWWALLAAFGLIALYGVVVRRKAALFNRSPLAAWLILLPIGIVAWAFMHASGIHATICGVLLAFTIPARTKPGGSPASLVRQFEHRFRPLSAGVAVPLFAFFAAGVAVGGSAGLVDAWSEPLAIAIMLALILGKPLGVLVTTWALTKTGKFKLDPAYNWVDLGGIGLLAGIGFTVSLLITELSFGAGTAVQDHAKVAVLSASCMAAVLAAAVLGRRNRHYRNVTISPQ